MEFIATEQQIKQIAIKDIEASKPLGNGFLDYSKELTLDDGDILLDENGLDLDYVAGPCVKLFIRRGLAENHWQIKEAADPEYQTWVRRYSSNETLVGSVLEDGETNIFQGSLKVERASSSDNDDSVSTTKNFIEDFPLEGFTDYD
jgi:hypothetical protein